MSRPDPKRPVARAEQERGRQNLADTAVMSERKRVQETPPTESDRLDGGSEPGIAELSEPGRLGQTGWFQRSVVLSGLYGDVPNQKPRGAPLMSFMLGIAVVILVVGGGVWFFTS